MRPTRGLHPHRQPGGGAAGQVLAPMSAPVAAVLLVLAAVSGSAQTPPNPATPVPMEPEIVGLAGASVQAGAMMGWPRLTCRVSANAQR